MRLRDGKVTGAARSEGRLGGTAGQPQGWPAFQPGRLDRRRGPSVFSGAGARDGELLLAGAMLPTRSKVARKVRPHAAGVAGFDGAPALQPALLPLRDAHAKGDVERVGQFVRIVWIDDEGGTQLPGGPGNLDRTRTPGSCGSWAAMYSFATRFMRVAQRRDEADPRLPHIAGDRAARPSACDDPEGRPVRLAPFAVDGAGFLIDRFARRSW